MRVSTIDYTATFHTLYPLLAGYFQKADRQTLLKSLVAALGDDAERVFVSWLPYLEETERRRLIAGIVSQNSPRLTALINDKLQSIEIGKNIKAGAIRVSTEGDDFVIYLDGISLDIRGLVDAITEKKKLNPMVVLGIKALNKFNPATVEEKGVSFISIPVIKDEITKTLQDAVTGKGIAVTVEDIDITYAPGEFTLPAAGTGKILDEESEQIIVGALAKYLVENAKKCEGVL